MTPRKHRAPKARSIGLVSDSHGLLLPALLERLAGVDLIVHAGDVGAASVMTALRAIAPLWAVAGNNDTPRQWPTGEDDMCLSLPETLSLELAGGQLVVVHGHQFPKVANRHARLRACFPEARCVVYGHSHRRELDASARPWLVNPGASGKARAYGGAGGWLMTVSASTWQFEPL